MTAVTSKTSDTLALLTGNNTRTLLRVLILFFIAGAAISSRLFSVIRKCFSPHDGRSMLSLLHRFFLEH
jgi:hypothetical protein